MQNTNNNFLEALNWRYATKKFDSTQKLSEEQLHAITESARLAPSSFGLQLWNFVVVKNPEIRAKLKEVAWNQSQITDASELIVFCIKSKIDEKSVREYVESISKQTGAPVDSLKGYEDMMNGSISSRTDEQKKEWAAKQVYIALGVALSSCASYGIDSCPMEGFDSQKFDEILGLKEKGLESKVLLTVGKRASDDEYASRPKVRYAEDKVISVV